VNRFYEESGKGQLLVLIADLGNDHAYWAQSHVPAERDALTRASIQIALR
jgi:hypothetical protein